MVCRYFGRMLTTLQASTFQLDLDGTHLSEDTRSRRDIYMMLKINGREWTQGS